MKKIICAVLLLCLLAPFALAEGDAPEGLSFDEGFVQAKGGEQAPAEPADEAVDSAQERAETFELRFDEGFSLRLPVGWVSYPSADAGIRYALGDGDGRYLYILAQSADFADFEAMRAAIDAREDFGKASPLDLNGQPFAAFIVPGLNASGCSTLLDGEMLTFLFTPQDDSDYMLAVAQIMASFEKT